MNILGPTSGRRHMLDKVWPFWTLSTAKREQLDFNINSGLLVSTKKLIETILFYWRGERERRANGHVHVSITLPYLIGHLPTKMTAVRTQLVLTKHLLIVVFSFAINSTSLSHNGVIVQQTFYKKERKNKNIFAFCMSSGFKLCQLFNAGTALNM